MARSVSWVLAFVLFAIGIFYAFNAYIQFQERGFAEAMDVPIAIAGILLGLVVVWLARRGTPKTG